MKFRPFSFLVHAGPDSHWVPKFSMVLDPKFDLGTNMALMARKAACATHCCSRAVESLRPRIMRWIYSTVIEPNLLYGVVLW